MSYDQHFIEVWNSSDSLREVAERLGLDVVLAAGHAAYLRLLGVPLIHMRSRHRARRNEKIFSMYVNDGKTTREISELVGLSMTRIYKILVSQGVRVKRRNQKYEECDRLLREGRPIAEIARALGTTSQSVKSIIDRGRRRTGEPPIVWPKATLSPQRYRECQCLRDQGLTVRQIASRLGISKQRVYQIFKNAE
jgi:DNA-binding CsgD family transcriptional regulator